MSQIRSLLVPITNSTASLEAVAMACRLAKPAKGKVAVVHVIEVLRSLPLNVEMDSEARRGEQLLRRAEEAASSADYKVTGELLQAREAGPAIVDEARDRGVDAMKRALRPVGRRAPGLLRGGGFRYLIALLNRLPTSGLPALEM